MSVDDMPFQSNAYDTYTGAESDPFLRALASGGGEAEADALTGAFAVRLVERWGEARRPVPLAFAPLGRLRALLSAADELSGAAALARLVERATSASPPAAVIRAALDYATALCTATRYAVAVPLYEVAFRYARESEPEELDLLLRGGILLARAYRWLGRAESVDLTLRVTYRLAREHGRDDVRLRVRLSAASSRMISGDLGRAARGCQRVRRDAARLGLADIEHEATGGLGSIAAERGRPRAAVALLGRALEGVEEPHFRERFLNSLGNAFTDLGHRTAARDTWLLLEATTIDTLIRKVVSMNLMRLAADSGDRPEFERRRDALLAAPPPGIVRGAAYVLIGESYELLDEPELAREAYARAVTLSTTLGTHYWAHKAQQQLDALGARARSAPRAGVVAEAVPDAVVERVAHRMGQLRAALTGS